MNGRVLMIAAVAAVGVASLASGSAAASTSAAAASLGSPVWGTAQEVPGTAALNRGGSAGTDSVSCASAGNCSAVGGYTDGSGHTQAFVASQVNGTWHTAIRMPGFAALNRGEFATIGPVSCASVGNCSAGGTYTDSSGQIQAFVVSQTGGSWGTAIEVPGIAALNQAGVVDMYSVSCGSAGNCSAGGDYAGNPHSPSSFQAFVVNQVNGTWHAAIEVPGTAALNRRGVAGINAVSCASAGNCSAGGTYADGTNRSQAFVVSQVNGTWGTAIEVPGTAVLNGGGGDGAAIESVSCASAGNCSAGGRYTPSRFGFHQQAFVVTQVNGTWGTAIQVPGTRALNRGGAISIGVSCGSLGNCGAGGSYAETSLTSQAYVVSQVNGTWGRAVEVPGTAALNQGGDAGIGAVSCAAAGKCSTGGFYTDSSGHGQAFVVSEK